MAAKNIRTYYEEQNSENSSCITITHKKKLNVRRARQVFRTENIIIIYAIDSITNINILVFFIIITVFT